MHLGFGFSNFLLIFILFIFFSDFYVSFLFISQLLLKECSAFYIFLFVGKVFFHLGIIVNFFDMQEFTVCLSVDLNTSLGYKSRKNWSVVTKFGCVVVVHILSFYSKNCDCVFGILQGHIKILNVLLGFNFHKGKW